MYLHFQINTTRFTDILRRHVERAVLSSERLGLGGVRDLPFDLFRPEATDEPGVFDHIVIDSVSFARPRGEQETVTLLTPPMAFSGSSEPRPKTFEAPALEAHCVLRLFAVRVTDLEEAGFSPVAPGRFREYAVRVELAVAQPVIEGGELLLALAPAQVSFGLGGVFLPAEDHASERIRELAERLLELMREHQAEWFPPIRFRIDSFDSLLGSSLRVWNAGVRVDRSVLDLRLQIDAVDLVDIPEWAPMLPWASPRSAAEIWVQEWRDYHANALTDRLGALDWGIYVPSVLFSRRIASSVETSLEARDEVVLNQPPTSTWTVAGGDPTLACRPGGRGSLDTRVAVHLPGACIPWGYDMDVNLRLQTEVSMPRAGMLRLDLVASHEVDPGDVFVCGMLNASLFAGAGIAIGGALGGWVGAIVGGVVGGLTGGFATLGLILDQDLPSFASAELEAVEGVSNTYFTEFEIPETETAVLGTISATVLTPCTDGLVIGGTLQLDTGEHALLSSGGPMFPRWKQPRGAPCPTEDVRPSMLAEIGANLYRTSVRGSVPVTWWHEETLSSVPSDWHDPRRVGSHDHIGFIYELTPEELARLRTGAGSEDPSVRFLVQTNAGARILRFVIPSDRLLDADRIRQEDEILERCTANQDLIDSFEERMRHLRDMLHEPEPFLGDQRFDAIRWSIAFAAMDPRTKLELLAGADQPRLSLGTIELDEVGHGRVELWQTDDLLEQQIALRYGGRAARDAKAKQASRPGFVIGARRYRTLSEAPLLGGHRAHALVDRGQETIAAVLTEQHLATYRIDRGGRLVHVGLRQGKDMCGVVGRRGDLVAWGAGGVWMTTAADRWRSVFDQPTTQLAFRGRTLVATTAPGAQYVIDLHERRETCGCAPTAKRLHEPQPDPAQTHIALDRKPTLASRWFVGGVAAETARRFALVVPCKRDRIRLMELVDTAVGGSRCC